MALCDPGVEFSMEQYQVHMLRSNLFHAKDRYQGFLGQGGPATESSQSAILAQVKADRLAHARQPVVLERIRVKGRRSQHLGIFLRPVL